MNKKAQAVLEFSLMFIIAAVLILGVLALWKWSKDNIGARQGAFEGSRVAAGKKASPGKPEVPFGAGSPKEPYMLNR
ncbi:MAG TPA: hypothetical protein PL125_07225 [Candidatus Omnitrophota bacterium]|nr:hypothetical protein [Candidatus Omnitrophota bacterium]HPT39965.1 hypothetical protein [Candidatus Omnitrophota bacterium]